jgi:uncharacterized protein (TIGR03437 family)
VGLKKHHLLSFLFISFGIINQLEAQPRLRLNQTAIGPISIATGANGPTQSLVAGNGGTGSLNLTAASSVNWLTPSVGTLQNCGIGGPCIPVNIALATSGLQKGTYTGVVTLSDPNAIDAPQTISITVAIGGAVPDSMTFYVPSNGNPVHQTFTAGTGANAAAFTQGNGPSLSLALSNGGSFIAFRSFTVTAQATPGMAPGAYNGSINVSGSSVTAENRTVPVTMNVTSSPVAQATTLDQFRIAQGAAKQTHYVILSNPGAGTLSVSNVSATTTSGGSWLTAQASGLAVGITVDPSGLAQGNYQGSVTISTNAANASITVPVQATIIAAGPPIIPYQALVSNATFTSETLGECELPALFGEQFTTGEAQSAASLPLPTTLGGATVFVNEKPAPIYYVSANQINFQVPCDATPGQGVVRVERDGQKSNSITAVIAKSAPKLLIAVDQSGAVTSTPLGGAAAVVHTGDYLTIYALGLGPTNPAVASGTASPLSPLATVPGKNLVYFGQNDLFHSSAIAVTPQFIGLTPNFVGLYQINVQIPAESPKGQTPVLLQGEIGASNTLLFNVQ